MSRTKNRTTFTFKAATGNGAVVTGSVQAQSARQVADDLMRQGLIPVYVERPWQEMIDRILTKFSATTVLDTLRRSWLQSGTASSSVRSSF